MHIYPYPDLSQRSRLVRKQLRIIAHSARSCGNFSEGDFAKKTVKTLLKCLDNTFMLP